MPTIPFTTFAFSATGGVTNRTMPDRLAEVHNVVDFGADPTGNADSTSAIQAAVDWTAGPDRGVISFPLGAYKITDSITYNYNGPLNITFRGEIGTSIIGTATGFAFDRHLGTPDYSSGGMIIFERLNIGGGSGGSIRIGSANGGVIRDCIIGGTVGITTEDAVGQSSKNIHITDCTFHAGYYIIIGGGGVIQACIGTGAQNSVTAYGSGLHMAGNRFERADTAYLLGVDSAGNPVGLSGFSITSTTTEGCWTAYDLGGPGGGLCEGFVIAAAGHIGHDSSNAGPTPGVANSQYGFRLRADCVKSGVIQASTAANTHDVAGIAVENASARADVVIRECDAHINGAGVPWLLPTNAYTARFVNNINTNPIWTYSGLPTGGDVFEGDEFDISDANTSTWGVNVTASGATPGVVRWNGSNWTLVGK